MKLCINSSVSLGQAVLWCFCLALSGTPGIVYAQSSDTQVEGEYIIKYDDRAVQEFKNSSPGLRAYTVEEIKAALNAVLNTQKIEELPLIAAEHIVTQSAADLDIDVAIDLLDSDLAEYISPNYLYHASATPNDPQYGSLWGLHQANNVDIDAPEGWDTSTGGGSEPIVVGVVDTGIDYNHQDLSANMWVNAAEANGTTGVDDDANGVVDDIYGYNGITNGGDPMDDQASTYHGTHCAGTIGARGNNGVGITGVAWNIKLMGLKFLSSTGSGATTDAIRVINYAVMMKSRGVNLRVLSNSWGGGGYSAALHDAIRAANTANILFVAAAGNDNKNTDSNANYPSNYDSANVISVAAIDSNGNRASFSNYGATTVDLAAPGVGILSTKRYNAYQSLSGTSMATPHVSGVAALVLTRFPQFSAADVKDILMNSVKPLGALNGLMVKPGTVSLPNALADPSNFPPTLASIPNISVSKNVGYGDATINASDADGDQLTYSAEIEFPSHQVAAAQVDGQYSFTQYHASYDNYYGFGEKHLSTQTNRWFIMLSSGALYELSGGYLYLRTTVDSRYFTSPLELINAYPLNPAAFGTLTFINSYQKLRVTAANGFLGSFRVKVSVSDGNRSDSKSFTFTVQNNPPTLAQIFDFTLPVAAQTKTLYVSAYDPDGDALTYSALLRTPEQYAYDLDTAYGFYFTGSYQQNAQGYNEKCFQGASMLWCILPNGGLYQLPTGTFASHVFVATFPSVYYESPHLLHDAVLPSTPGTSAFVTFSGNQLTYWRNGEMRNIFVTVTASDGNLSDKKTFAVHTYNQAPSIQAINDQVLTARAARLEIPLIFSDPDSGQSPVASASTRPLASRNATTATASVQANILTVERKSEDFGFEVVVSVSDGFLSTSTSFFVAVQNSKPQLVAIPAQRTRPGGESVVVPVLVSDPENDAVTLTVSTRSSVGNVLSSVVVAGSALSITPASAPEEYTVTVTASDGLHSDSTEFRVVNATASPVLEQPNDVIMNQHPEVYRLNLNATDEDGDVLTYSAALESADSAAYELDQRYQFYFSGAFFRNYWGQDEKWFKGEQGRAWFFILPSGAVYRSDGRAFASSEKLAQLDSAYHLNPTLLMDAAVPIQTTHADLIVQGAEVQIVPRNGFSGVFYVKAGVSDGQTSNFKRFRVTVQDGGDEVFTGSGGDSDGDGVSDEDEIAGGSDPFDAGSFIPSLQSPVFALWNSFLRMINILELVNPNEIDKVVTVSLFSIDGTLAHRQEFIVPARSQYDVILNDLPGFVVDSYGIVKIEFDGVIDGRLFYYRTELQGSDYEFAFGIPLSNATVGSSAVGFNTFQPSTNPSEAEYQVANWLTIVNLSESQKSFRVRSFVQNGSLLAERTIVVPGFGRADVDGGHGLAGASVVGLHTIEPESNNVPYIAQLIRYGGNARAGETPNRYAFAFPLVSRAGTGRLVHVPMSRQFDESNWLEVINTSAQPVEINAQFLDAGGQELAQVRSLVPAFGQQHILASSYLTTGQTGTIRLSSSEANSIIAQSMFYFRSASSGSVEAMYGSQAREALGRAMFGSFNRYLAMENWLRVVNNSFIEEEIQVIVNGPSSNVEKVYRVAAQGSLVLPIHDASQFQTSPNSYGTVEVRITEGGNLYADLLRVKRSSDSFSFAAPTPVR